MLKRIVIATILITSSCPSFAQDAETLPDPATITVPDTTATDPKVLKEGYKFFYFHNPAVSFAEAAADIAECRSLLAISGPAAVPGFVPWTEPVSRKNNRGGGFLEAYGLLGLGVQAGLAAIIVPKIERGLRNNKLRRCMEPRGYSRFAISEASWDTLNEGDGRSLIVMQANLASGPRPSQGEVVE